MIELFRPMILALFVAVLSAEAHGQVNPASSLLVRGTKDESPKPNLDSGRYTVRPGGATAQSPTEDLKKKVQDKIEEVKEKKDSQRPVEGKADAQPPTNAGVTEPSDGELAEKIKDIFLGGDEESISKYKTQLHPDDRRQNILDLSFAPTYIYADSSSSYWFHKYASSGPGFSVAGDVWLTPFMGLHMDYMTSLSADMTAVHDSSEKILVEHRSTAAGMHFRKFSSLSRKSPSVVFGVTYSEYQLLVPKDQTQRTRIKKKAPTLTLLSRRPDTTTTAWLLGVKFMPKLKVEEGGTSAGVTSGSDVTAYGLELSIGREYVLDRHHQVFWRLSHRMDKSVYEGAANVNDPIEGVAPTGVSVTSGVTLLEIGYSWGG